MVAIEKSRQFAIGDLLIRHGGGEPERGRGGGLWDTVPRALGPVMQFQTPSEDWRGFPVLELALPGWEIWLLGELYGQSGRLEELEAFLGEIVGGKRGASHLNGHLLLVAREQARQRWHVWTDRFASIHAYYACSGEAAALGTSFAAVAELASRKKLDWSGLTGFFGFGFFPADRTYFEDVRILRPATHYVFNQELGLIQANRYWDWRHEPERNRSYDKTVDAFADVFGQVMKEQTGQGRIALPISGGLDSRSTVAALEEAFGPNARQDRELWAYSYGYSTDSVETGIARQIAQARGLPFQAFAITPYLFERLDRVINVVEGFQDVTQCRQAAVVEDLRRNTDYLIAAHWGDVWLSDMGMVKGQSAKAEGASSESVLEHTLHKMVKRGRGWLLQNVCSGQLDQPDPEAVLEEYVREGLAPLEGIEDADFRVKAFKTENWSARWTLASIRMFQAAAFPRLPFYDTRVADLFCTVPSEFVKDRQLQIDYLKQYAPDLARINWQVYDANLYDYQHFQTWHLPKRAFKKALRVLSGKKVIERNWELQFGGAQGEAGLQEWLLRPALRLHDFVSKEKVEQLIQAFRAEPLKEGRGYTVCMLLTFSAWLERNL